VADTGIGFASASGPGFGLANVSARLAAQFGDSGSLALGNNELGGATATITLPLAQHGCRALTAPGTPIMAGRRLAGATQSWRAAVRGALRRITWRATGAALALGLGMSVWLTAEIALYLDPQQSLAVQSVSTLCIRCS
jgi:hypothetical protein